MKIFSMVLGLAFAASFNILTAAGLKCSSVCAACWKIGEPGVDIKMTCDQDNDCGGVTDCPPGYEDLHCAKTERCMSVDFSMNGIGIFSTNRSSLNRCTMPDCDLFGPCICGTAYTNGKEKNCKIMYNNEHWC